MQTMFIRVGLILLLGAGPLWSQVEDSGAAPPAVSTDMVTPSPVSVEGASPAFAAETERSNYVRGGLGFSTTYDNDFITRGATDVGYSIRPSIAIDKSGTRLRWTFSYSPGFTFYQQQTLFSQSDHDLAAYLRYRLSPHVTVVLKDGLAKSSLLYNHFDPNPIGSGTGILQTPNQSIISPVTDTLTNIASGEITYQFSANGMIGASATERELIYLDQSQVPGLFNSRSSDEMAFYTYRLSGQHYIGVTYEFQQFLSHPNGSDTQTQSTFGFYQLYTNPMFTVSLFGGPQHFEISRLGIPTERGWVPAGGVSLGWQRFHSSGNLNFTHMVGDGGGLISAVVSDSVDLVIRHQLTRDLTVGMGASYANNSIVDAASFGSGGHTVAGSVSLDRTIGEHFSLQMGYTRAHQSYAEIPSIAAVPDRNRAWAAISYNFSKPLGR
jgi:hypothetical protein